MIELVSMIYISQNEFFDSIFLVLYVFLFLGLLVAFVLLLVYLCSTDSHKTRRIVPWALLTAAIVNFLIAFWIFLYIQAIYSYDKVYIQNYDKDVYSSEGAPITPSENGDQNRGGKNYTR